MRAISTSCFSPTESRANLAARVDVDPHLVQDRAAGRRSWPRGRAARRRRDLAVGEDVGGDGEMGEEVQLLEDDADAESAGMERVGDSRTGSPRRTNGPLSGR